MNLNDVYQVLLIFSGRRWLATPSYWLPTVDQREDKKFNITLDEIIENVDAFHGFWNPFKVDFLSGPMDVATPSDAASPSSRSWYRALYSQDPEVKDLRFPGHYGPATIDKTSEIGSKLVCTLCSNSNPCSFAGICNATTAICDCRDGYSGVLCEREPESLDSGKFIIFQEDDRF